MLMSEQVGRESIPRGRMLRAYITRLCITIGKDYKGKLGIEKSAESSSQCSQLEEETHDAAFGRGHVGVSYPVGKACASVCSFSPFPCQVART